MAGDQLKVEIQLLWSQINAYPDKEQHILDIFNDSELAFLIAMDDETDAKKKEDIELKLGKIQSLMQKTTFLDYDIYEFHYWIEELNNNTYWRDKIEINGKKIERKEIKKWCNKVYNTLRYYLLSTGVVDLNIGASGNQPSDVEE